jgi:voltage-gated potassium channel
VIILRKFFYKAIRLNNWILISFTLGLVVSSSFIIYLLEPDTFKSPFNGFWWVMTTVTTVGYGDFYPVTVKGKWLAIFLYLIGIGLIGVVIGKVVDSFSLFRRRRLEGKMKYKGENHLILIGWSTKAKFAVEEILESDPNIDIIIIDHLQQAPFDSERVHYVHGDAADENTLTQANLTKAKSVIIFADDTIVETSLSDGKTLLIATTVERLAPDAHTIVEIMEEQHIKNFNHVNVNEFILSRGMISRLAVRATLFQGVTNIFRQLLSSRVGDDLYKIDKRSNWKTYKDAFDELLSEGATLIADGPSLNINRNLDQTIPDHAKLYVICDKETFKKINRPTQKVE